MNPPAASPSPVSVVLELLTYYNLETDRYPTTSKPKVLNQWLQSYSDHWVKLALIESLYQGRYKMVSVEQLLALWSRRGQPTYHFNSDFEALVCNKVPYQMEQAVSLPDLGGRQSPTRSPRSLETAAVSQVHIELPESWPEEEPDASSAAAALSSKTTEQDVPTDLDGYGSAAPVATAVFGAYHLGPVTLGRLGHEPIQQFTPVAEPDEFCKRLDAIARPPAMMTAE